MYAACASGKFPSIETMCDYGLSGFKGNPISIFECYKLLVQDGVTEDELTQSMENGTLSAMVMQNPRVQESPYYLELLKQGGVHVAPKTHFECLACGFYSCSKKCSCS
jgi:hypothetical protein